MYNKDCYTLLEKYIWNYNIGKLEVLENNKQGNIIRVNLLNLRMTR